MNNEIDMHTRFVPDINRLYLIKLKLINMLQIEVSKM
jgi:hypothetical protein